VTPQGLLQADLLAQGERIKAIGDGLPTSHDTRVLDAEGCYVLPGVIDAHTHIHWTPASIRPPMTGSLVPARRPVAVSPQSSISLPSFLGRRCQRRSTLA